MEKAVQEICDLKNFLLVLNENQSTALRLQIKLTWFEEIFEEYKMKKGGGDILSLVATTCKS